MSNAVAIRPQLSSIQVASIHPESTRIEPSRFDGAERRRKPRGKMIRRRSTREQGRALEVLGHAVEYLVDSRLRLVTQTHCDDLAVQMLMRLNREVFAECAEVVSLKRRLRGWLGW
jgi:hypothetical protein